MSKTGAGPWKQVLDQELEDSRQAADPLPLQTFPLTVATTSQFIKFELVSWYGHGGGLLHFDIEREGVGKASLSSSYPLIRERLYR